MASDKKPDIRYLLVLMFSCFCVAFVALALLYLGLWIYFQLILAVPHDISWQSSAFKSLRSAVAVGPILGLGVWLHAWLEYRNGKKP